MSNLVQSKRKNECLKEKQYQNKAKNYDKKLLEIDNKIKHLNKEFESYKEKTKKIIIKLLTDYTNLEKRCQKDKLIKKNLLFGSNLTFSNGSTLDKFIEGKKFEHLIDKKRKINAEMEKFSQIKLSKKQFEKNKMNVYNNSLRNEIVNLTILDLKKQLSVIEKMQKIQKTKKLKHISKLRKFNDEQNSIFSNMPILKERYILLRLTGKGGFSEVWKAYDLNENRYVACKIHQLNSKWEKSRKKNYIKHTIREYEIHKTLSHPTIVPLYHVFGIDLNSFCTVLQYCNGKDLEYCLKKNKYLSEEQSKLIIFQILQGLKYLSEKIGIIHFDLKPSNVLFHNGIVQITDFGLSKKLKSESCKIELSSQGAGTYWYLPPETFTLSSETPPLISSKVDIWSAGVILFQMLFGKRPFGHKISQEIIYHGGLLHKSNIEPLDIPSNPQTSNEVKV